MRCALSTTLILSLLLFGTGCKEQKFKRINLPKERVAYSQDEPIETASISESSDDQYQHEYFGPKVESQVEEVFTVDSDVNLRLWSKLPKEFIYVQEP